MSKTAKDFDTKELIESEIKFAFLNLTHNVEKRPHYSGILSPLGNTKKILTLLDFGYRSSRHSRRSNQNSRWLGQKFSNDALLN